MESLLVVKLHVNQPEQQLAHRRVANKTSLMNQKQTKEQHECYVTGSQFRRQGRTASRLGIERHEQAVAAAMEVAGDQANENNLESKGARRRRRGRRKANRCRCCLNKMSCPLLVLWLLFVFALSAKTAPGTLQFAAAHAAAHHHQTTANSIQQQQQQQTTSLPNQTPPFLVVQPQTGIANSEAFRARSQLAPQSEAASPSEANGSHANSQLVVHSLTPISASGSLAFLAKQQQQQSGATGSAATQQLFSSRTAKQPSDQKCQTLQVKTKQIIAEQQASLIELLAIEGANLKLNLVIASHAFNGQDNSNKPPAAGHRHRHENLSWRLIKDGHQVISSHQRSVTPTSIDRENPPNPQRPAAATSGNNFRFIGRHLVGETNPETIGHLFRDQSASRSSLNPNESSTLFQPQMQTMPSEQQFVLSPYLNEQQLNQLEQQQQSNSRQSISSTIKKISSHSYGSGRNLADSFLANGQQIDWLRLSSHLRANSAKFNNYFSLLNGHKQDHNKDEDELCAEGLHSIKQFVVLQLEFSQLTMADRGQYQLILADCDHTHDADGNSCDRSTQAAAQPAAVISIQLIEDMPRFVGVFQPQLLDQGDRLSIKCEATGFTLPQISWFLDGQQLSEQQPHQQHQQQSTSSLLAAITTLGQQQQQLQFRIGDYVSQDNHVHSFVNSSSVRASDGGFYKCQANNGFHTIEHEARIDVRGQANIERPLPANVSVLVGTPEFQVQCPFSGYPVALIEWYFKPITSSGNNNFEFNSNRAMRIKRRPLASGQFGPFSQPAFADSMTSSLDESDLNGRLQKQLQQDSDKEDEWLSQAESMTMQPNSEDYPEPIQDYPQGQLMSSPVERHSDNYKFGAPDLAAVDQQEGVLSASDDDLVFDYGDIQMDFQQQDDQEEPAGEMGGSRWREKRSLGDANHPVPSSWIKLPQSRRHQVHLNGTLIVSEISRQDFGFYKCHVASQSSSGRQHALGGKESQGVDPATVEQLQQLIESNANNHLAWSNEMQLNVLVPPVISPFSSSESLREGMRNFLTCSVIEGDSPVKLNWLKDGRPIEEHLEQQQQQARIRVEQTNEYTSTLYFSQVEFIDSGNYTCMATNKAASVNYTAKMLVNVPPKWIKSPKDFECVSGQNIVIDCQAEAHPNPRIWWEIGLTQPQHQQHGHPSAVGDQQKQLESDKSSIGKQLLQMSASPTSASAPTANSQPSHPPNHYKTIISNSRIHILENASLVIRDVNKQDQGYYLCQAANNFGLVSSLIKLTVNVGASFPNKYQMKYVKLNEQIELDCEPTGQSPVTLNWFFRSPTTSHNSQQPPTAGQFNGQQPSNDSTSLTMFTRFHNYFHRQANQSILSPPAPAESATTTSQQQLEPSLGRRLFTATIRTIEPQTTSNPMTSATTTTRHELDLAATAADQPHSSLQPQATNLLDQQQLVELDSTMSFEVLKRFHGGGANNNQQAASELVRLHIKQAKRAHSGEYICQAANQFGGDERLIKLFVQEPPDPINEINAIQVDSRSISLAWSAPFNGNSPIASYLVEWAPLVLSGSSNNYSLSSSTVGQQMWSHSIVQQPAATITGLTPTTSYEIRVRAQNQLGHSAIGAADQFGQHRSPFIITTIEEAPSAPPGDIQAIPLSSSSLQVTWLPPAIGSAGGADHGSTSGNQRRQIKGYYLGYKVANSNDSYIFKTVQPPFGHQAQHHHQQPQMSTNNNNNLVVPIMPVLLTKQLKQPHGGNNNNSSSSLNQPNYDSGRLRVLIDDLKRSTKYSIIVQAFNSAGPGPQSDPVEAKTLLNDPPPAPALRVGLVTYTSIELQWAFQLPDSAGAIGAGLPAASPLSHLGEFSLADDSEADDGGVDFVGGKQHRLPQLDASHGQQQQVAKQDLVHVDGYYLYYRPIDQHGDWLERKLSPETHTIVTTSTGNQLLTIVELLAQQQQPAASLDNKPLLFNQTLVSTTSTTQKPQQTSSSSALINHSTWQKHSVSSSLAFKSFRFVLDQLVCGNSYQIYLVAYNSFGSGLPSQVLRTKTRGSAPFAPRRHDFHTVNSTFVQLNLEAWLDGGCSLNNFEIKYKQLSGRNEAAAILMSPASSSNKPSGSGSTNNNWLLLSSNINPEQRSIELRDLQPETWYAIWATAESVAGTTDAQYAFMTLDRFGQVPGESVELFSQIGTIGQSSNLLNGNNNLPALFKSGNGSLRSILSNFSQNNGLLMFSPLLMSACLCLILFATCSLFLIRRYNNLIKDNVSIDSRATSGALSSVTPMFHHHHHHQQTYQESLAHQHLNKQQQHQQHSPNNNNHELMAHSSSIASSASPPHHEHYSMKMSPCRTGTTIITANNSTTSTSNNSTSALLLNGTLGGGGPGNDQHAGDMLVGGMPTNLSSCGGTDSAIGSSYAATTATTNRTSRLANNGSSLIDNHYHPQSTVDLSQLIAAQATNAGGLASFGQAKAVQMQQQQLDSQQFCPQQTRLATTNNRFATLARTDNCNFEQQQQQLTDLHQQQQQNCSPFQANNGNHFKTLPLNQRPVSSFLPQTATIHHQHHLNHNQNQQMNNLISQATSEQQQQQIYSKLRLLHAHQCQPTGDNSCGNQGLIHEQQQQQSSLDQTNCDPNQAKSCPSGDSNGQLCMGHTDGHDSNNIVSFEAMTANQINLNGCQQHIARQTASCQQQQQATNHNCEQDDYALPFQPKWV